MQRNGPMRLFDLRSDTVTRPTPAMREVMARADVGDDVYGEDPTANALERRVAALTGKDAAIFVPSGTMANQVALLCLTQRGDEVLTGEGAHVSTDESGAGAAWSGVQFRAVGSGGLFTAKELAGVMRAPDGHSPRQGLVAVESSHNRAGGRVFPHAEVLAIARVARDHNLPLHLDGARLWNAAIAAGLSIATLAEPFDTVNVCFSKGLGAPIGSALCGSSALIARARVYRKMLGGGMRQAGVIAAAALYAIDHHIDRLRDDHAAASAIAAELGRVPGAGERFTLLPVETNQINIDTPGIPADRLIEAAKRRSVLAGAMAPHRTRVVTHLDLAREDVPVAARALADALAEVVRA